MMSQKNGDNMKNIIMALAVSLVFLGCSSKGVEEEKNVVPALVVGKVFQKITLNDQFEKAHSLKADTYKVIFAFSKDSAHTCNDFFKEQKLTYLADNHTEFIADVSAAPSLIRSIFIMPGLKEMKHTVLLIESKEQAAPYKKDLDIHSIAVVYILNGKIQEIKHIKTADELKKIIEDTSAMSLVAPLINKVLN